MTQSAIATAADYVDAMVTARRAKNTLAYILLVMLVAQLALFFFVKYKLPLPAPGEVPTTASARVGVDLSKWFIGAIDFLGVVVPVVMACVLLLILQIMLVGRLIGLSKVTSAFIWCLVLILLLFPWQAFLANTTFTDPSFKVPGVLYTWSELATRARWHDVSGDQATLLWARFVLWPLAAVFIVLIVQTKSSRGLKLALGEANVENYAAPAA